MTDAIDLTALDHTAREQFKKRFEELDSVKESREAIEKNLFTMKGEKPAVSTYHDLEKYFREKDCTCVIHVGSNVLTFFVPRRRIKEIMGDLPNRMPFFIITVFRRMSLWTRIMLWLKGDLYQVRHL